MRTKTGIVTSDSMDKTIVVLVSYDKKHELYHKPYKKEVKFKAHDPENKYKVGDEVTIYDLGRRLSKSKSWTTVSPQEVK